MKILYTAVLLCATAFNVQAETSPASSQGKCPAGEILKKALDQLPPNRKYNGSAEYFKSVDLTMWLPDTVTATDKFGQTKKKETLFKRIDTLTFSKSVQRPQMGTECTYSATLKPDASDMLQLGNATYTVTVKGSTEEINHDKKAADIKAHGFCPQKMGTDGSHGVDKQGRDFLDSLKTLGEGKPVSWKLSWGSVDLNAASTEDQEKINKLRSTKNDNNSSVFLTDYSLFLMKFKQGDNDKASICTYKFNIGKDEFSVDLKASESKQSNMSNPSSTTSTPSSSPVPSKASGGMKSK